jgi:pyridoxal 5-phosphate dependent beta-lyase
MTTASTFAAAAGVLVSERVVTVGEPSGGIPDRRAEARRHGADSRAREDAGMTVETWLDARTPTRAVHLDVAGAGRPSREVLDAEIAHLHREAALGAYVAAELAEEVVGEGRAALGALVGLDGTDVCFLDGAGSAFATLLAAWPLPAGARVGTVPSEYGSNARALRRLAAERGWQLVGLPVDDIGRISEVPADLDLVTFPQVASQRGTAQPVEQVLATGTPLLLDVAQSLGQTPVPTGCAAYVGTSRKWLCGPRGVGFAVVPPAVQETLAEPPTLAPALGTGMRRWEAQEAHVAGRVGLAVAAQQWEPGLLGPVRERAAQARAVLDGVAGWRVREPVAEPTGITTLVGGDPFATRAGLLEDGFITSAIPISRSDDLDGPVLRVSTAAWVTSSSWRRWPRPWPVVRSRFRSCDRPPAGPAARPARRPRREARRLRRLGDADRVPRRRGPQGARRGAGGGRGVRRQPPRQGGRPRSGCRGLRQRPADQRPAPGRRRAGAVHAVLRRRDRRCRRRPDRLRPQRVGGLPHPERRQQQLGRRAAGGGRSARHRGGGPAPDAGGARRPGPAQPRAGRGDGTADRPRLHVLRGRDWNGKPVVVCRTGYTGELGFELLPRWDDAGEVWDAVLEAGRDLGVRPCGLGARDTLRTEMGYPLHGQDLSLEITPVQARSGWAVGWDKPRFWGRTRCWPRRPRAATGAARAGVAGPRDPARPHGREPGRLPGR